MNEVLSEEVSDQEVLVALNSIQKLKSLGPNGFPVDFYLGFYDLIKDDLLLIVWESQFSSNGIGSFNTTFLCLIPKTQDGFSFVDYYSITCYNLIYNIISKVITRRFNLIMWRVTCAFEVSFREYPCSRTSIIVVLKWVLALIRKVSFYFFWAVSTSSGS